MKTNLIYSGASMLGTFRPGDRLVIKPIPFFTIKRGDIIVFSATAAPSGDRKIIVHRVWAVGPAGLITRGDHNLSPDQYRITALQVFGKVTHRIRINKKHRVTGGARGFMWAGFVNILVHGKKAGRKLLKLPYRWLKRSHVVEILWQPKIKQIVVRSHQERVIKFIHKKKVVGYHWPQRKKYLIKKPYDLIIHPPTKLN